jgi:hypothetical protein
MGLKKADPKELERLLTAERLHKASKVVINYEVPDIPDNEDEPPASEDIYYLLIGRQWDPKGRYFTSLVEAKVNADMLAIEHNVTVCVYQFRVSGNIYSAYAPKQIGTADLKKL